MLRDFFDKNMLIEKARVPIGRMTPSRRKMRRDALL